MIPSVRDEQPEVIEPEVVGLERPQPLWRRMWNRVAIGFLIGSIAVGMILAGVFLTLTILGAFIGIPLILVGFVLLIAAVFLPISARGIKIVSISSLRNR